MQLIQLWARGLAVILAVGGALSGAAYADTTLNPQTDAAVTASETVAPPSVDGRLSLLLGQERTSFAAVTPSRIEKITTPIAKPGEPVVQQVQYSDAWLDTLPLATGGEDWSCLAKTIYFEARGESVKGEFAVAEVVVNRADSPDFPHDVCAVVNQGCQFSYKCDGRADVIRDPLAYERAGKIARLILDGAPRDLTDGATYFHTVWVHPGWSHRFEETTKIGAHIFYKDPVQLAAN